MASAIEKRVSRLEESYGDSPCERCNNTTVVVDSSGNINVIKDQVRLTAEASRRFHDEERPDDRCPLCQKQRQRIKVGWGPRT